jgi:hypothetical protein
MSVCPGPRVQGVDPDLLRGCHIIQESRSQSFEVLPPMRPGRNDVPVNRKNFMLVRYKDRGVST